MLVFGCQYYLSKYMIGRDLFNLAKFLSHFNAMEEESPNPNLDCIATTTLRSLTFYSSVTIVDDFPSTVGDVEHYGLAYC